MATLCQTKRESKVAKSLSRKQPTTGKIAALPMLLVVALTLSAGSTAAGGREIRGQRSPLVRLAQTLELAEHDQRLAFTRIALEEMIAEYAAVASEARGDSSPRRSSRRAVWSGAVEAYVSNLGKILWSLQSSTDIAIITDTSDGVRIRIDEQPVIITGPRLDRPAAMTWRIMERYCSAAECSESLFEDEISAPLPNGVWSFGEDQGPTLSTTEDVHCIFGDASNRRNKEMLCKEFARDLATLARALRRALAQGYPVELEHLSVAGGSDAMRQTVTVNSLGDYLRVSVPVLASVSNLGDETRTWIGARLAHRPAQLVVGGIDRSGRAGDGE